MNQLPPQDPTSSEADSVQLALASAQGAAYQAALAHMAHNVADDGGATSADDYVIGYAIEEAEGMYVWDEGELVWRNPHGENAHVEIAVTDAADGRFVPGVKVTATLTSSDGHTVGPFELPMLWHPMLYHYGANVTVPADGTYRLDVHVEPPDFMRHDEINGRRFAAPVDVSFDSVRIERDADPVDPPDGVSSA